MSRRAKILQEKLAELEGEFHPLLVACLKQSARGRWGLFGQNDQFDDAKWWRSWSEAKRLIALGEEIRSIRLEFGQPDEIVERFFELRSVRGSNAPGEPKLAESFLKDLGLDRTARSGE